MGSDEAFPRDCTCTGSCRGSAGLASGWRCALDADDDVPIPIVRINRPVAWFADPLQQLARNIAIAAALARSFMLGEQRQIAWARRWQTPAFKPEAWRPGCGRTAP